MRVRVITPPDPILTPSEVSSSYADNDATIQALIAAATGEIDGPSGWLGRALGPQTLELSLHWPKRHWRRVRIPLPCPPHISIASIQWLDYDETLQTLDAGNYALGADNAVHVDLWAISTVAWWRDDALRIQYQAGYDGTAVSAGGTGPLPGQVKQAIILAVTQLKQTMDADLYLRRDRVEGIGWKDYMVNSDAGAMIRDVVERMLSGLRVYQ